MTFWSRLAAWILGHPRFILAYTLGLTALLGYWALQVETDHTPGQFLSSDSKEMQDFERAGAVFGQSQTELYIVFRDESPYDPAFLSRVDTLARAVATYPGVEGVLSLTNVPYLQRVADRLTPQPLYTPGLSADDLRARFEQQPFLNGLLLSHDGTASAMMVTIEEAFNDTAGRVDLVERIVADVRAMAPRAAFAGFPYLRSVYARRVITESPLFTILAMVVSLAFLFMTFRAGRALLLPLVIVGLGILWTLGLVALFGHRLNIVTAVLPALLVIIGMANAIHLITKFYIQYTIDQDREAAVTYTIRTVGQATLLTCLTTAIGFGVLVLSGSRLLAVFGKYAAAGIMMLYVLSITLIPLAFLYLRPPRVETSRLATHRSLSRLLDGLTAFTRRYATAIIVGAVLVTALSVVGITRISSDIYIFSDFYEDDPLRQDLAVFEDAFGGLIPLEIVIAADRPGRFQSLGTLRRLDRLKQELGTLDAVGRAMAFTDLVKLANQAYFGGHPATYRLPSGYEMPFLQSALRSLIDQDEQRTLITRFPTLVDSTFGMTRIYLGVNDIGTTAMNALTDTVLAQTRVLFPAEQYEVFATGTALLNTRSGENLVNNLFMSLAVALLLISLLMALLFRSLRLTLISLVPNVIPLLLVGGAMGFTGIILKPSTALIFPLAFGIAVDATIHFLAKYRLMRVDGLTKDEAVLTTMRETGKALLFATMVLMSGFLVFTLSSFGGTVNMGALTALTLAVSLVANLLLLPALLYRFGPTSTMAPILAEAELPMPE